MDLINMSNAERVITISILAGIFIAAFIVDRFSKDKQRTK